MTPLERKAMAVFAGPAMGPFFLPISRNYTGQIGDDRGKERVC